MSMVCPQCDELHEQRLTCPNCGGRLHYRGACAPTPIPTGPGARWMHSPIGRLLLGLLLAQGLTYAFHRLFTAYELAFKDAAAIAEADPRGYLLLQGMQLAALVIGGVLAGGGQRSGALLGLVLGLSNGALTLAFQEPGGPPTSLVPWVGEMVLHAVFGALAGWIGASI
jgi:hypothetical protein